MTRVSEAVGVASAIEQNSAEPAQRRRGASKAPRARPFLYLYTTALWFRRAGRREGTRCMTCPGVRRTAVFACGRSGASRSGSGFKVAEDLIPVHPSARGRRGPDAEKGCLHNEGTLVSTSGGSRRSPARDVLMNGLRVWRRIRGTERRASIVLLAGREPLVVVPDFQQDDSRRKRALSSDADLRPMGSRWGSC